MGNGEMGNGETDRHQLAEVSGCCDGRQHYVITTRAVRVVLLSVVCLSLCLSVCLSAR